MDKHMIICPVCGSKKWTKRYVIDQWNIEECDVCGFARIDPLPSGENRADYYSRQNVEKRNTGGKPSTHKLSAYLKNFFKTVSGRNKSGIFYKKIIKYLDTGSKILDIGCGDGSFLKLAGNNFDCTGIEISEYLAGLAKKQTGIKVITGNFLSMDIGHKYNGITMISLVEHLDDPARAIRKCFDLLNQGGLLMLKTVNYGCINRVVKGGDWTGFRPPDHVVYFKPSNLKILLKKTGFRKINIAAWPFNDNMYCCAWR